MTYLTLQKADLAVADLTITYEREQGVDFTMPFMNLGKFASVIMEWVFLIRQAPANKWSLFSHMVSVRLSVRPFEKKTLWSAKQNMLLHLDKAKSFSNAVWGLVDHLIRKSYNKMFPY